MLNRTIRHNDASRQTIRVLIVNTVRRRVDVTMSLPAGQARPVDLGTWARAEWQIENRVHYVRDVTLREDAHQARTGNGQGRCVLTRRACELGLRGVTGLYGGG
jgi:predicted transposase YbfD/YdcC